MFTSVCVCTHMCVCIDRLEKRLLELVPPPQRPNLIPRDGTQVLRLSGEAICQQSHLTP